MDGSNITRIEGERPVDNDKMRFIEKTYKKILVDFWNTDCYYCNDDPRHNSDESEPILTIYGMG